jgi:hypothetical protein
MPAKSRGAVDVCQQSTDEGDSAVYLKGGGRSSGVQEFRSSGVQEFRSSGVAGVQELQELQNLRAASVESKNSKKRA